MGVKAHRHGDLRVCGATTIVVGQNTTFVDGRKWSVKGDPNTDGGGALIPPAQKKTFIQGKEVIGVFPNPAVPDAKCQESGGTHCSPVTLTGSPTTFVGA